MPKDLNNLERPKGTVQEELGNVTKLLDEGKFIEAIQLVQRCSYWFQECPLFAKDDTDKTTGNTDEDENGEEEQADKDESQGSESGSEENNQESDESEDDSGEQRPKTASRKASRKSQQKNKGTTNWFTLAMRIYLREPPKKASKNQKLDEHDEMESSQETTEQVKLDRCVLNTIVEVADRVFALNTKRYLNKQHKSLLFFPQSFVIRIGRFQDPNANN